MQWPDRRRESPCRGRHRKSKKSSCGDFASSETTFGHDNFSTYGVAIVFKCIVFIAISALFVSHSLAQEPTKEEWAAAMQSARPNNKKLDELTKTYNEIRDNKTLNKREKQSKLEKAKNDLVAEKRKIWAAKEAIYPEVDVYSLKKGDIGIIVTSLSDLTNRPAVDANADPSAFLAQTSEMATMVQHYKVLQVLGPTEFLCNCGKTTILVAGMSTADMRDGKSIERLGLTYCVGNATYPTSNGTNTVMKVVPVSKATIDRLTAELKSVSSINGRVRTWTDITGKFKIEAELVDYDGKKVTIKKTDGTETVLPIAKISKTDREYVEGAMGVSEN